MKHAFKKALAMLLVLAMVVGVIPSVFGANVLHFTDVDDSDWFAPYVKYVYEHDPQLMNGTSANGFEPEGYCTRAMAAVVLYRLADPVIPSIKPSTFIDLKEDWYKNGVAWAQQNGVVNGVGGNRFDPDGMVTREQLVTMIWRYAGCPEVKEDYLKSFPDADKIAAYAKEAFNWAISMKIIGGSDGKLLPQDNATRAQFAKIITVFDEATKPCTEHTWDEGKVTKAATCTEDGEMLYTCTRCGETKTEIIPATGHNYEDGVCTGCGDKLADENEIVIYYTNDVHTYIDGKLSYDNIADLKAQTASIAAGVLLLDAGDHVQGTAYGSMDKGKTIIELMNAAGYDAATLGNHEFDYGMDRALELIDMADYSYLSANFYHEKDGVAGDSVLDAYKLFEVGGKKIAVVGITTPESFTKSTPKYFQDEAGNYIYGIAGGTDGAALYASVQTAVDAAKAAGADYIIALGHCGDDPASKPWTSEEVIANTTGIDAFIDGHSHSTNAMTEVKAKDGKTVVLTQTGSYFGAIGRMSITKDGIKSELITEYDGSDKDVAEIKNAWISEIDTKLGEVIGHTALTFDNYDKDGNRLVRKQETNTGDFAADALYYLFDNMDLDVDLAIMNGGGVRNKAVTGDISYKTCKSIHTFGNVACLITVTGQQILDALEWGARDVGTAECGGFLQVSGVSYEIHSYIPSTVQKDDKGVWTAGPTGEYRVKNVKIGGEPLDLTKTYNMAGYNYTLRDCGDGFAMFKGAVNVLDYVMEDYMVLANYVKSFPEKDGKHEIEAANSVLGANYAEVTGEGRITIVPEKGEVKDEYVLAASIKGGDEVVIYNPGHGMAIRNETDNDWYLMPETITPTGNKIVDPDAILVWTVVDNGNGTFSFVNGENKIMMWLSESDGKTYFELTNNANYEGATGEWKVISGDATNNLYYIQHSTLSNNYGPAYIECYYNANKDVTKISGYSTSSPTAKDYGFQFYVKGAEAPTPDPDPDPDPKPENEYVLASELKEGDEVVIVCAAKNVALGNTYNGYYNNAIAVTPENGKLVDPSADVVWTVGKEGEFYTFSFNGQKIAMGTGFTSMPLGEVNYKWQLQNAATEGAFYLANLDREAGKEYRMQYQEAKGTWSAYHTIAEGAEEFFALNFYVKGESSEQPHVHVWGEGVVTKEATCTEKGIKTFTCGCGATKTEEITALGHIDDNNDDVCDRCGADLGTGTATEFVLASELKEGDEVVIVCAAKNVALGNTYNGYYNNAIAVTPENGKLVDPSADVVWTVGKEGEFYTFSFNGQKIAMGTGFTSMPLGEVNYKWQLQNAATEGAFYLANLDREAGKEYRMQYQEAKGTWSAYHTIAEGAEGFFALNFYVKGAEAACAHEWDEGEVTTEATCTTAGVKTFTCAKCGATKTEEITALGHIDDNNDDVCDRCEANLAATDCSVATAVAAGDKIVIVVEHDGKYYAAANDNTTVSNAINAIEVTVSDKGLVLPDGADLVWEVAAGSADGVYTLKTSDGKFLAYGTSGTQLKLAAAGSDFAITCGNGTSTLLGTTDGMTDRGVSFRNNAGVPQFRLYKSSNNTGEYSWKITIYKLG